MGYQLSPDLSFCMLGGDPYFLDLRRDRYFRLERKKRAAFVALTGNADLPRREAAPLIERRILRWTDGAGGISPTVTDVPERSLIEETVGDRQNVNFNAPEIAFLLSRAWFERKFVPLADIVARRRDRAARTRSGDTDALRRSAGRFAAARRMIPIASSCLPDSLALIDFLAKRGHPARLVFGVRREPFAAHCWVQTESCLLNETVDIASGFTPICVVP